MKIEVYFKDFLECMYVRKWQNCLKKHTFQMKNLLVRKDSGKMPR